MSIFLWFLLFIACVYGCGITTHIEIANRARTWFNDTKYADLLQRHQNAFQAGAPFPDWGYGCGGMHEESEAAHWNPFQNNFAKYIQKQYPQPFTLDQEKSVAFLFGMHSHFVADYLWHGLLDVKKGFINVDAALNFHGSYSEAHTNCDIGGDIVSVYENDIKYKVYDWYVPYEDILKIYQEQGFRTVTRSVLAECTLELFAGDIAEKWADELLLAFAVKSPFLMEEFQDYHTGGLDDMSIRTEWEWHNLILAIETNQNLTFKYGIGKNIHHLHERNDHIQKVKHLVKEIFKPRVKFNSNGGFEITLQNKQLLEEIINKKITANSMEPITSNVQVKELFTISQSYAYNGYGLAKLSNGTGQEKIIIGSHGVSKPGLAQLGRFDIIDSTGKIWTSITGKERYARMGYSVTVLDMNHDGRQDVIVSSPAQNLHEHHYDAQGQVLIFLTNKNGTLPTEPTWIIKTKSSQLVYMGEYLTTGDINQDGKLDLVISSPYAMVGNKDQCGIVSVFISGQKWNKSGIVYLEDADLSLFGESEWNLFGKHVQYMDTQKLLFVGAPSYSINSTQSVGKVYAYSILTRSPLSAKLAFSISGTDEFDRFGSYFAVGMPLQQKIPILAVSAVTRTTKELFKATSYLGGSVFFIDLSALKTTGVQYLLRDIHDKIITELNSDQSFARFGFRIGFVDLNHDGIDDVYITEPYRNTSAGHASGALYVWNGGVTFPRGQHWESIKHANSFILSNNAKSKFGSQVIVADINGDGINELIISAPRHSKEQRYQGIIYVASLT